MGGGTWSGNRRPEPAGCARREEQNSIFFFSRLFRKIEHRPIRLMYVSIYCVTSRGSPYGVNKTKLHSPVGARTFPVWTAADGLGSPGSRTDGVSGRSRTCRAGTARPSPLSRGRSSRVEKRRDTQKSRALFVSGRFTDVCRSNDAKIFILRCL